MVPRASELLAVVITIVNNAGILCLVSFMTVLQDCWLGRTQLKKNSVNKFARPKRNLNLINLINRVVASANQTYTTCTTCLNIYNLNHMEVLHRLSQRLLLDKLILLAKI
jgi:hypothetical protein